MWSKSKKSPLPSALRDIGRDPGNYISLRRVGRGCKDENPVDTRKNEGEKYSPMANPSSGLIGDHYFDDAEGVENFTNCMRSGFDPVENKITAQTEAEYDEPQGQTLGVSRSTLSNKVKEEEDIWDLGMDARTFYSRPNISKIFRRGTSTSLVVPPDLSFLPDESNKTDRVKRVTSWVFNRTAVVANDEKLSERETKLNFAKSVPGMSHSSFRKTRVQKINQNHEIGPSDEARVKAPLARPQKKLKNRSKVRILRFGSTNLIPLKWQTEKKNPTVEEPNQEKLSKKSSQHFCQADVKINRPEPRYLLCANHSDGQMNRIMRSRNTDSGGNEGLNPGFVHRSVDWLRQKISSDLVAVSRTKSEEDDFRKQMIRVHAFTVSIPDGVETLERKIKSEKPLPTIGQFKRFDEYLSQFRGDKEYDKSNQSKYLRNM